MSKYLIIAATLLLAFSPRHDASAQSAYPERPIVLVTPFAAGAGSDLIARLVAESLSRELGQQVVVENKPGANTTLGTLQVVRSRPDGYTLLWNSSSLIFNMILSNKLPYDTFKALAPVAVTATSPHVLVVSNSLPVDSFSDFIKLLKSKPGQLTYASTGNANINNIIARRMLVAHGTDARQVAYQANGTVYPDLLAGRTEFFFGLTVASQFVNQGRLKALLVTGEERIPALPNVPSYPELGLPNLVSSAWQGIMAPAGTPEHIVTKLNGAVQNVMVDPVMKEKMLAQGFTPMKHLSPEAYRTFLGKELEIWTKVLRDTNIIK